MYINILFILFLLFIIIYIYKLEQLHTAVRWSVISILAVAIMLAALYEYANFKTQSKIENLEVAFKASKTLICGSDKAKITKETYIYESGTSSLIPKRGVVGKTYSILECRVDE